MKIAVLIKIVNGEPNPFDACALEAALKIDDAEITVISMGRRDTEPVLRRLTRHNIDCVLVSDMAFAGSDTLVTAKTLTAAIKHIYGTTPDCIFCGRQSIDGDTAQVPPCLSQIIGAELAASVMSIDDVTTDGISCTTRERQMSVSFPCVLSFERINTLRYPSIRSKERDVRIITNDDLRLNPDECGLKGSPTQVLKTFESVRGRRKCKYILPHELDDIIAESLAKSNSAEQQSALTNECEQKLPIIYAVGEDAAKIAQPLAECVKVLPIGDVNDIVDTIRREKAEVVLWDSSYYGRNTAPVAAAMLNTGLCADCTLLETDGSDIFFYRPAMSGSITAKIRCKTLPKMATVRTAAKSHDDVILAIGKGAVSAKSAITEYVKSRGYAVAASRAAVDSGDMPYSAQVGLTGKTVAPKVYIAVGISGAVHHTCAIENAGTVIAINPDKSARIFDYADYGIIASAEEIFE